MQPLNYELSVIEEECIEPLLRREPMSDVAGQTLDTELRRLRRVFIRCVPGTGRSLLEEHFRLHYRRIWHWSDELFDRTGSRSPAVVPDAAIRSAPTRALAGLDSLMRFMETHLSDYLPKAERLPRYRLAVEMEALLALAGHVDEVCADRGIPESLRAALRASLTLEGAVPEQVPSHRIAYCKRLGARIMTALVGIQRGEAAEKCLMQLLWKRNLNSAAFFRYCLQRATAGNQADWPLHEQQQYYLMRQREVATAYREGMEAYSTRTQHITEQLYRAFDEERAALRRLEKVAGRLADRADPEDVFRTCLSARQLALFVRVLINTGVIVVERPQRLFDFICRHFRSVGAERLSPASFYKNSHKKLASDVERVEEVVDDLKKGVEELSR